MRTRATRPTAKTGDAQALFRRRQARKRTAPPAPATTSAGTPHPRPAFDWLPPPPLLTPPLGVPGSVVRGGPVVSPGGPVVGGGVVAWGSAGQVWVRTKNVSAFALPPGLVITASASVSV